MKKLILLLIPFLLGAAPARLYTYPPNTTILSSQVTANEDAIFNYLTAGVSVFADNTIVNADINASAAISDTKLDLATIAQAVAFNGAVTFSNNVTFASQTIADLGTVTTALFTAATITTVDINGGTIDGVTIGASVAPTVTNLGTVTTVDINGGTLDNVQIGGTTATGELIVNNSSDAADGLGSQGTSGQYLQSAGAGANPIWANVISQVNDTDSGTAIDTNEIAFLSVAKTITSGNTVLLIASGYSAAVAGNLTVRLKHGTTVVHTVIVETTVSEGFSLVAIVTGLSGSTTFSVTGQRASSSGNCLGNLAVIEF